MVNWQEIHPNFTEELAQNWQEKGFGFEQTKEWINLGFNPDDYEPASFFKNKLCCDAEDVLDYGNIATLREIYQKSLEGEKQREFEVLQIQQAIHQSLLSLDLPTQETNEDDELQRALALSLEQENKIDTGWLTDDNIAYILENDEIIRSAENIQVKTDIANIYLQAEKAKKNEAIDNDFWSSINTRKKYVLLPLRVNGNHWSLLLFVNNEYTGEVNWLYYLSSLSISAATEEIKEISSFLKQVGKRFGSSNNSIINENNLLEMVFQENPRQPNTWDCGVYICEFIKFLCVDQYYNLNETTCQITSQQIKEFREKWRNKIGAEKWCKWDAIHDQKNDSDEDAQLAEALRMSLLTSSSSEEQQLNETLLLSGNAQQNKEKETENLQQELAIERSRNEFLIKQLENENRTLREQLFQQKISAKQKELDELMNPFKEKDDYEDLIDFLEAHEEFTKTSNEYAKKQIEKSKKRLLRNEKIKEEDLEQFSQVQTELTNLKKELERKTENVIEIAPKLA